MSLLASLLSYFVLFFYINSWLLFCIALNFSFALPTVKIAIIAILKAIAKSKGKLIAIAFKSEKKEKKEEIMCKKSDKYTRSNKEKSNMLSQY